MARILVSIGEASGDQLAAPVVARLRSAGHEVFGSAAPRCVAAGLRPIAPYDGLAAHGLTAAAQTVVVFRRALRALQAATVGADLVWAVDFPELNRRLLSSARCRTAWLAPPQAWAWRPWRARALREVDWVGCVLPHAARWYAAHGVSADFVGHPLGSKPPLPDGDPTCVALLPGSRPGTINRLLPVLIEAARRLRAQSSVRFVWGRAPAGGWPDVPRPPWLSVVDGARAALAQSGSAWVGAGTATLDAALAGRACLTVARLDPVGAWLARRLVHLPAAGLPNLVLGERVFPERLLEDCTPAHVADAGAALLAEPARWADATKRVRAALSVGDWPAEVARQLVRLLPDGGAPMLRDSPWPERAAGARAGGGDG